MFGPSDSDPVERIITKELQLRPYQERTADAVLEAFGNGKKRIMVAAPTGSGKTELAIYLMLLLVKSGHRVAFVADTIPLVLQTSDRLQSYGIMHGVQQSTNTYGKYEPIQVCSAQTITVRGFWDDDLEKPDVVFIDEAHTRRAALEQWCKDDGAGVVGLSATPLGKQLGLYYDELINMITTEELIEQGLLVRPKMYACRPIDMFWCETNKAGEYRLSDIEERAKPIIGDMLQEYKKYTYRHFDGPVPTLAFGPTVDFCESLAQQFCDAGIDFRVSSYADNNEETIAKIDAFRNGEFTGLVSCEKFVKGFDVPGVKCIIGAHPYAKSTASVIQQWGRGMRTEEGKDEWLLLLHDGNDFFIDEVREIWKHGIVSLDVPAPKLTTPKEGIGESGGSVNEGNGRETEHVDGEMIEVNLNDIDTIPAPEEVWQQCVNRAERIYGDPTRDYYIGKIIGKGGRRGKAAYFYRCIFDEWPKWGWRYEPDPNPQEAKFVARAVKRANEKYRWERNKAEMDDLNNLTHVGD